MVLLRANLVIFCLRYWDIHIVETVIAFAIMFVTFFNILQRVSGHFMDNTEAEWLCCNKRFKRPSPLQLRRTAVRQIEPKYVEGGHCQSRLQKVCNVSLSYKICRCTRHARCGLLPGCRIWLKQKTIANKLRNILVQNRLRKIDIILSNKYQIFQATADLYHSQSTPAPNQLNKTASAALLVYWIA